MRRARLTRDQHRLLEAFYEDLVPAEMLKSERQRIEHKLAGIEQMDQQLNVDTTSRSIQDRALDLARGLDLADVGDARPRRARFG